MTENGTALRVRNLACKRGKRKICYKRWKKERLVRIKREQTRIPREVIEHRGGSSTGGRLFREKPIREEIRKTTGKGYGGRTYLEEREKRSQCYTKGISMNISHRYGGVRKAPGGIVKKLSTIGVKK